jgi:hypothetical protein
MMERPHRLFVVLLTLVVSGSVVAQAAQSAAPDEHNQLIGVWNLNVARSTYSPGPAPKSETRTYVREGKDVQGIIDRAFADGRREHIEYTANFDREYPVTGTDQYDHVILKRIDPRTAEAVLSHAGRVFGVARRVISNDGKSMTITFTREAVAGPGVRNVAFYTKAEEPNTSPK